MTEYLLNFNSNGSYISISLTLNIDPLVSKVVKFKNRTDIKKNI